MARLPFEEVDRGLRNSWQYLAAGFDHVQKLARPFRGQLRPFAVEGAFFEIRGEVLQLCLTDFTHSVLPA
jgi:hypothetical protein